MTNSLPRYVALAAVAVLFGVALIAAAVLEWPERWAEFRGLVLGLLAGAFGTLMFFLGGAYGRAPRAGQAEGLATPAGTPTASVQPEDAKRWLQRFLDEQQHAPPPAA